MSERYLGTHRPPRPTAGAVPRLRGVLGVAVGLFVGMLVAGTAAVALTAGGQVSCDPGVSLEVKPDGTWACMAPVPSPSPTPSPSATVSPSPSPSVSPTTTTAPPTTPPPSPTVSPSPTGPVTNCIPQPSRCGYPDATNTGAKGTLTVVNGDVTLSFPGQVYTNKEIHGCVKVTAPNVTIRNVRVLCPRQFEWGIEYNGQGGGHLLVEDTTVSLVYGSSGIGNNNFTARRVNVYGGENGFMIYDGHALLEDNYCHNLTDEVIHPEAHTDCVEGNMIYDTTIRHNTWLPGRNTTSAQGGACGLCNPSTVRTGWRIENNLLDGGSSSIYCLRVPSQGTQVGSMVINNRFGSDQYFGADGYADSCIDSGLTWSGNVRDATGATLPAQ